MARKILIDCDPGIDDAVALCMALFDPRLDIMAITATAGTVDSDQATNNVTALIETLDPPRYPRVGKALAPSSEAPVDGNPALHGADGLGGLNLRGSNRQHLPDGDRVMADVFRRHKNEVTLLCLGPLTNLARLARRDPAVLPLIDKVIISGGAVQASGNASVAAEFNMFFDPAAAKDILASATTKSMVPLDVTEEFSFGVELLERLPSRDTRVGHLLHRILQFAFRAAHHHLGREMIPLYAPTALLSVLEPELFQWEPMAVDVETKGELTRGMTVADLRMRPQWTSNMEVATEINEADAEQSLVRGLRFAGQQT
ncbi:nucleoside hydrolase [Crateriforma spongiae]|uniref:nucleoside hydrolase n=1 Tax=Crateriforma spongiae TaxID=2724528 RepID=UPI001447D13E|nr:nucleoside hydrolase [Crateriforma spongiae]